VRIFRHYLQLPIVLLALVEAGLLLGVFFLAAGLRFDVSLADVEAKLGALWPRAFTFTLLVQMSMVAVGLYSSRLRVRFLGVVVRIGASVLAATVAFALVFYALPELQLHIGRGVIAIAAASAFAGMTLVRFIFGRVVDENLFKRRVLVYGCGRQALSISQLRRRSDQRGFTIVGYVRPDGDREMVPSDRLLLPPQSLLELARDQGVDEIVVAMDDRRRAFPVQELLECRLCGIDVTDIVTFLERETGKVRLDVLNPSWMIFADGFRRDPVRLFSERSFDLLAGFALLFMTWPFMLVAALAIKLEDGWRAPVLYRQRRVGLENRVFDVLKFRSMCIDAEKDGQARWAAKGDDRVTRVGAIIRKVRIDELPQILNVLKGDMSFVGPRPERPEFVAELNDKIPYYRERHCVKPGITGWAQLCYPYGSSEHDAAEKLQYDLYYVKNHSLLFDLMILLQTAEVVLWGKGGR
jgi:sugar transferase (PEP-CTERM system associated)